MTQQNKIKLMSEVKNKKKSKVTDRVNKKEKFKSGFLFWRKKTSDFGAKGYLFIYPSLHIHTKKCLSI